MTHARALRSSTVVMTLSAAILVMGLGGILTERGAWHQSLVRPEWQPPSWLFAPVWTIIFALAVTSFLLTWQRVPPGGRRPMLLAFGFNAIVNVMWSFLFFQLHRPDLALIDVTVLWVSIASLIFTTGHYAPIAGALLVPYFAWVSFAALLNYEIVRLNGPFG